MELVTNCFGVNLCSYDDDWFPAQQTLGRVLRNAADEGGVIPAIKVNDVMRRIGMVQQVGPG